MRCCLYKLLLKPELSISIIDKIRYQRTLASVDKGIHGFSRGKTTASVVILVGGRQPACLVCLAVRRLSSVKNSGGLAERSGTSVCKAEDVGILAYVKDDHAADGGSVPFASAYALVN